MNWSASNLVKQSAAQIAYLAFKQQEAKKTPRMYKGDNHAEKIVKKEEACSELRGTVYIPEGVLYFCIDMFKDNIATEIKMVEGVPEDWYFNSSLLQCTFYAELLKEVIYLDTPTFRKKEGYPDQLIEIYQPIEYRLLFGKELYKVEASPSVKDFYLQKLSIVHDTLMADKFDLLKCKQFDAKYKHKEFNFLKSHIKYKQIKK